MSTYRALATPEPEKLDWSDAVIAEEKRSRKEVTRFVPFLFAAKLGTFVCLCWANDTKDATLAWKLWLGWLAIIILKTAWIFWYARRARRRFWTAFSLK